MDPLTLGIGAVSLGLQLFGGFSAANTQNQIAQLNSQVYSQEKLANKQRQDAMELSARRQTMETFRNVQRARAMGTAAAVNQGAQFGSGLQGGNAQATDQGFWNASGIQQNLQIGRNLFGIDNTISGLKSQISSLQGSVATDEAIAGMGGALGKNAGTLGNIFSSFGSLGGAGGNSKSILDMMPTDI